ncbi:MAG: transporter suffix domain-containing protein [Mariprofundaceae bacterium]|nr:transporter suffix domain-containing protein [Mariprofundaceae bacterium]
MKRRFGLFLFWFSWLLWGLVLFVPFVVDADLETIAMLTTLLIAISEGCFWLSLLLLGKSFYLAVKSRVLQFWRQCFG